MDEQEKPGGFIQFPLQLLATDWKPSEIMSPALSWSAHLLVKKWSEKDPRFEDETAEDLYKRAAGTVGFNYAGCKYAPRCRDNVRKVEEKLKQLLWNEEPSKIFVRLPLDYAFEIRDGQWKEPEARVYLALACIIGVQKFYARAGWPLIAQRAAGIARKGQRSNVELMTRKKVDYQLKKLCERDLFACFCYNKGVRFWSFPKKFSREQIARSVVLKGRIARQKRAAESESDAELTARIMAEPLKPKA
jgi:hypothetical protein